MKSLSLFIFLLLLIAGFPICNSNLQDPSQILTPKSVPYSDRDLHDPKFPLVPITNKDNKLILLSVSDNHDTAAIAALDGTIYSVDRSSGKVTWSFASGSPLCSSYHIPFGNSSEDSCDDEYELVKNHDREPKWDGYFIDCGDDWNLYEQSQHFDRRKLKMTIEDYVNSLPHISNGALTYAETKLTIFLLDARTGRLLRTYGQQDSHSFTGAENSEQALVLLKTGMGNLSTSNALDMATIEPLLIKRTDYTLKSHLFISEELLWNMTVAKIDVISPSQASQRRHSLEYKVDAEMSLPGPFRTLKEMSQLSGLLGPDGESSQLFLPSSQSGNSRNLNKLGENRKFDHPKSLCEVEKTCLMEIEVNDQQQITEYWVAKGFALLLIVVGVLFYYQWKIKQARPDEQPGFANGKQTPISKRRKTRQKGNSKNNVKNRQDRPVSSRSEDLETNDLMDVARNEAGSQFSSSKVEETSDGRRVGKLFVSNKEIAKGSNGTVVFEGIVYDDRHSNDHQHPVAVKRLVLAHNDVAFKEIKNLRESRHPNIVHLYGVEQDLDFVYIALERCACSLNDLIHLYSDDSLSLSSTGTPFPNSTSELKVRLQSSMKIDMNLNLWEENGYPSPQLLKLMWDIVCGLGHLHELGIIHRDLKPHNVLITGGKSLSAKLADMGISKRLQGDMLSLGHQITGYGSSGWQAPEQLLCGRQTRAVDLFSLGCVLFFCMTKGKHPFGEYLERDPNIVRNNLDLFLLEHIAEAKDLLSHLLDPEPENRPKAEEVLHHPLFWSSEKRLLFLQDASDRVELADKDGDSDVVVALENTASLVLDRNWDAKLDALFINNIGNYRRYKYDSVRDLLRLIRNKSSHYKDLPKEVQEILGPYPDGCYDYYSRRFPKLLIEAYKVISKFCQDEVLFRKYFKSNDGMRL